MCGASCLPGLREVLVVAPPADVCAGKGGLYFFVSAFVGVRGSSYV